MGSRTMAPATQVLTMAHGTAARRRSFVASRLASRGPVEDGLGSKCDTSCSTLPPEGEEAPSKEPEMLVVRKHFTFLLVV